VNAPERISDGVERWEPTAQDVDDTIEALNHDCGHPDHNRAEVVLWMKLRIAALEQERTAAVDYRERASDDLTFLDKVRAENERLRTAIRDDVPTPEKLEAWGEWFDDPKNPFIGFDTTKLAHHTSTAGYVCRVFAAQLRALGSQTRGRNAQLPDPLA
jgi:hypothetical protein